MPEFPSDWHRQAHIDALKRELEGCRRRAQEAEDLLSRSRESERMVRAELDRITGRKPKAKAA